MAVVHFASTFRNRPGGLVVPRCKALAMRPMHGATTTDTAAVSCKACAKQLGTEPAERPSTSGALGTCQVCFRAQRVRESKAGPVLVVHGYKRPGHGYITGKCLGAGFLPFELSCERTEWMVAQLTEWIDSGRVQLAHLEAGKVPELAALITYWTAAGKQRETIQVPRSQRESYRHPEDRNTWVPSYPTLQESAVRKGRERIAVLGDECTHLRRKVDQWKPQPFPPEPVDAEAARMARLDAEAEARLQAERTAQAASVTARVEAYAARHAAPAPAPEPEPVAAPVAGIGPDFTLPQWPGKTFRVYVHANWAGRSDADVITARMGIIQVMQGGHWVDFSTVREPEADVFRKHRHAAPVAAPVPVAEPAPVAKRATPAPAQPVRKGKPSENMPARTASIASLAPFSGFGGGQPQAGDLAAIKGGEIVAWAVGVGRSNGVRRAQSLVHLAAYTQGAVLVTLTE